MVAESWFRNLWGKSKNHEVITQKAVIGVLAFEFASLMSKVVHLWQSLSDKNVKRLREEIADSIGVKRLVSDNEDFIVRLICYEIIENLGNVARSVSRLGPKCSDSSLRNFETFFEDLMGVGYDPCGWKFSWKKMEKKVRKMERYISVNANLYQEMEILSELEQTLKRMTGPETDPSNLLEYQKKVVWKRHDVRSLQEMSVWNRSYDYAVKLLARSLFTIFMRVKLVFGIHQIVDRFGGDVKDTKTGNIDSIYRSQSVSAVLQATVHPSENVHARYSLSGPLGPPSKANLAKNYYSGPLGHPLPKVGNGQISGTNAKHNEVHSAALRKLTQSGPIFRATKILKGKKSTTKHSKQLMSTSMGPMKGCLDHVDGERAADSESTVLTFSSKSRLLNALPETLGSAGLALHYANVIIVIEKLSASPHLISLDARDDLYNMLPASVRSSLRAKLKPYAKGLTSSKSVYDPDLVGEWSEALLNILEWLSPLAHNMIRWQSVRSFEQQNMVSKTNVHLVQTLYFANQEKTEAIVTELLVGLNYIWRFGRELTMIGNTSEHMFDDYFELQG